MIVQILPRFKRVMIKFRLEDFFDTYEHCPELINLASSDALPWGNLFLQDHGLDLPHDESFTFSYPDVKARLLPGLIRHCNPPAGMELLPTSGAAEAIALAMHEISDRYSARGDRCVAIPSPSYGAFQGLAELLSLPTKTYEYHPMRSWAPDFEEVLELSKQCAALVITNPHNPTGHVMSSELLQQIAAVLAANDATLIVDEVFRVPSETASAIELGKNVIVIGSLSKAYGLPGLRLGWIAASKERLAQLRTVQQYLTLTLNAVTVVLGARILANVSLFSRADLLRQNRRILADWTNVHKHIVSISPPVGGTTVCLTINESIEEETLFKNFLRNGVLLVPGLRCFEVHPEIRWFRLGYGTDSHTLHRGLDRISTALTAATG
jgi:aspartate/methionine/tyrosine aminotransferase